MPDALIAQAVKLLQEGRLVAFPTETVYGLGADATNSQAVRRIYQAKGRPPTNPLIVHIAGISQAKRYTTTWTKDADLLARRFWPGPLTLVLPRHPSIAPEVSCGLGTVGLRCPRHNLALELLQAFDGAVAAPSANRSNRVSPTTAGHVHSELGSAVDLILDGGPCEIGIESTVLELSSPLPTILRPGNITASQIQACLGREIAQRNQVVSIKTATTSPGQHAIHYSPQTPCYRFPVSFRQKLTTFGSQPVIILLCGANGPAGDLHHKAILLPGNPDDYARHLYASLHAADLRGVKAIYIELPPDTPPWVAVRDRLFRAGRPLPDNLEGI